MGRLANVLGMMCLLLYDTNFISLHFSHARKYMQTKPTRGELLECENINRQMIN